MGARSEKFYDWKDGAASFPRSAYASTALAKTTTIATERRDERRIVYRVAAAWLDSRTLLRYAVVGGASALVEFLVFNVLVYLKVLPVLAANLTATSFIILFSFFSHRHFTFRNPNAFSRQVRLYVAMLTVSILLNNALVYLFVLVFGWPPPLAKFLQLGLCFIWNFSCSRLIVFATAH